MDYNKTPKNAKKYSCEKCNFICRKESEWNRHIITRKHIKSYAGVTMDAIVTPNITIPEYVCVCGKIYKYRQGLYKHKIKCYITQGKESPNNELSCSINTNTNTNTNTDDKELLIKMLLKNQDVMEKLMEIMPQIGNTTTNSHNITNNNQFNIQMFLNDHCKNAMNLTDFIQSLPITSETYDSTIENGLTKTITNMMVNGLNELDILERPIHCTDASRKTLYVKDSDKWEKDNELLYILKGIKQLSLKQRTLISKWKDANEGWKTDDNLQSRMTHLVCNSMSQIESDEKETGKIIRSISKNVYLDNETKKGFT